MQSSLANVVETLYIRSILVMERKGSCSVCGRNTGSYAEQRALPGSSFAWIMVEVQSVLLLERLGPESVPWQPEQDELGPGISVEKSRFVCPKVKN